MDRLTSMEIYSSVVEAQGFTAAATRLGISRAAVSKHVLQLEERLGARLLNRTTRRVSVTEVGQAYYERCKRVLSEVEAADLLVDQLHSEPRGTLKVSAPMSFGVSHVGPAIAAFMTLYPELSLSVSLNDRFTDLIEEGVDVAIRISARTDSSLVARRLAAVPCVAIAAPGYLARAGVPARPGDLVDHACLSYTYLASGQEWRLSGRDGSHAVRVSGPLKANNGDVLLDAVRAGHGIALLPEFLVRDDIAAGRLRTVLDAYVPPALAVFAVSPPNRFPTAKVRSFVDFLAERFAAGV